MPLRGGVEAVPLRKKYYYCFFFNVEVTTAIKLEGRGVVKNLMALPLKKYFFAASLTQPTVSDYHEICTAITFFLLQEYVVGLPNVNNLLMYINPYQHDKNRMNVRILTI